MEPLLCQSSNEKSAGEVLGTLVVGLAVGKDEGVETGEAIAPEPQAKTSKAIMGSGHARRRREFMTHSFRLRHIIADS